MGFAPKTFYIGKPPNTTNEIPAALSYLSAAVTVPVNHVWVVTHIFVHHTGDDGTDIGKLSLGFDVTATLATWSVTDAKEKGFYHVRPFRAGLVEPFPNPLRLPLPAGYTIGGAQTTGTPATPLTVFITGTDHSPDIA